MKPALRRLAGAAALAAVALSAVWGRPSSVLDDSQAIMLAPVPYSADRYATDLAPFELTGAWEIRGDNSELHSFSGLAVAPAGALIAVTDRGRYATFPRPGEKGRSSVQPLLMEFPWGAFSMGDAEALQVDPGTGRRWVAFEHHNSIMRVDPGTGQTHHIRPEAMQEWPSNSGAELMVRLDDGQFVVAAETRDDASSSSHPALLSARAASSSSHPALLFARDPVSGVAPTPFRLLMPEDYRPVDAALLPDGRVLVLGRTVSLPLAFSTVLAIADPAQIRGGEAWHATAVARLSGGPLSDNYEGIAVERGAGGDAVVWLVSDNNQARFLQRSLLLRLRLSETDLRELRRPDDPGSKKP